MLWPCHIRDVEGRCRRRRDRPSLSRPGLGDVARFQHRFGVRSDASNHPGLFKFAGPARRRAQAAAREPPHLELGWTRTDSDGLGWTRMRDELQAKIALPPNTVAHGPTIGARAELCPSHLRGLSESCPSCVRVTSEASPSHGRVMFGPGTVTAGPLPSAPSGEERRGETALA